MSAPLKKLGARGAGPAAEGDRDVESLVRGLVEQADGDSLPREPVLEIAGPKEVVLDVRVDGVHYTLLRSRPEPAVETTPAVSLSPREREIVRLIAKGLPTKAIAASLDISLWTVATHLRRIFIKLGVNSRAEMVARVLDANLLREE
jgi:DNA-binding CsgD family transcriptional regulator